MWNFNDELSLRDCVRGVITECRGGVCQLMLETGEHAYAFFSGLASQTEVLCTVLRLPDGGRDTFVSIDCEDSAAAA